MQRKTVRYGLVNSVGDYLVFNEINYEFTHVSVTDDVEKATVFITKEHAYNVGYAVKFGTTVHNYIIRGEAIPADVVKIKRYLDIEKEVNI